MQVILIKNDNVYGWQQAIHGMRNSWNSWDKSDTKFKEDGSLDILGNNDYELMKKLCAAHPSHAKFRRMISVYCDITAPLYWWKEFDTYKVGTVSNSQSTMHTITKKPFDISDFSISHLSESSKDLLEDMIELLNHYRASYIEFKDKEDWWQIIQLLPTSYNQTRTVMMNYEVLSNIYQNRKDHRLDEWKYFCNWIKTWLPHSYLITGEELEWHCAG